MKKKKILFIITKSNWGGAQRYVFDLITSIPGNEFEKKILFGKTSAPSGLDARIREIAKEQHISYDYLPHFQRDISLVKDLRAALFLYRYLTKERPDIVHLNSAKAGGLGAFAARLAGIEKIIFTAHGWPMYEDRSPLFYATSWVGSWLTILFAHRTITLHERDLHSFDGWPLTNGKIVKIYNGVGDAAGLTRGNAREALAKEYGVRKDGPLIGTVGELTRNKGQRYLLEAFTSAPKDAVLVIIGDGEDRKSLESKARDLGIRKRVFFTGFAPGPKYLRAFDLFVLPSVKEGFPYVVLEAGMREVPVIATAVGGIPEVVVTGTTGLLVAPKEPDELAQAMKLMLEDPSIGRLYAAALVKKVEEKFQFATVTLPATLSIYRS